MPRAKPSRSTAPAANVAPARASTPRSAKRTRTRVDSIANPAIRGLVELGLTMAEARAYVALLDHPAISAADLATTSGLARPKVYEAVGLLIKRGFCEAAVGESATMYRPLSPDAALRDWLSHREHERQLMADHDEQVAGQLVRELPVPEVHDDGDELHDYFESVEGRRRTSDMLGAIIGRAEHRIAHMTQPPFVQPRVQWNVAEAAAVKRGVEVRTVLTTAAAADPARWVSLVEIAAPIRVADTIPMKLIVRDGVEAMVSLRNTVTGEQSANSIVIRHPDLVGPLLDMFERVWQDAAPLQSREQ